jgi:alkylation response protein AidB-like acyl-CoA dehydrogenase
MNFDFGETETSLQKKLAETLRPAGEELTNLRDRSDPEIREGVLRWVKALSPLGYLDLGVHPATNSPALVSAQEIVATLIPSLFLTVEVSARLFGRLIAMYGEDHQKSEILPNVARGDWIGAVALTEETISLDNNPFTTAGVPHGEGFLVDGSKGHVPNAPIADRIAVAGRMGEDTAFFVLDRNAEGLSIGDRLRTLGYPDVCAAPISLSRCIIRKEEVLGPVSGHGPIQTLRRWEDEILTAASLGLMHRSFQAAREYAKGHVSGGKPIIAYQEIGFKLAEMFTLLQTSQLLAYRAAWMSESRHREADVMARCAKVFCSESAEEAASHALQILGGKGLLSGNPAEQSYRDAKYLQVTGTSTEISRMKIADGVLGDG